MPAPFSQGRFGGDGARGRQEGQTGGLLEHKGEEIRMGGERGPKDIPGAATIVGSSPAVSSEGASMRHR